MYILLHIAYIIIVLILTISIYVFFIFPIFLNFKIFFSKELKKLFFTVNIFGFSVLSGYAEQIKEGFAVHLTKNYAFIIPYKNLLGLKASAKPLKDYHIIKFDSEIDMSSEDNLIDCFTSAFIINFIFNHLNFYLINKKPYFKFSNEINVYENKNILNISINLLVLFNFLMIFLSLIKIAVEKIIYEFRNKKRQN